jgi:hypothetical protein
MPSLRSPFRRVGRVLADHARRLQSALESLANQVRAAIARIIGQATGDAMRDAVTVILDGPPARPAGDDVREERERPWNSPRRSSWPNSAYDPYAPDPYGRDSDERYPEPERGYTPPEEDDPHQERSAGPEQPGRWSQAVATGCQAAGWWLKRHPGRLSVIAAVGVGVAAGFAALFGGPLVVSGSALAASALGILALTNAARSAASFAADATNTMT